MSRILIFAIVFISAWGCASDRGIKVDLPPMPEVEEPQPRKRIKIEHKWTYQPFEGIANCVDTIGLSKQDTGFYYACEQEMKLPVKVEMKGNHVEMRVWGFTVSLHEHSHSRGHEDGEKRVLKVLSKYTMDLADDNSLVMKRIEHLGPEGYVEVEKDLVTQVFKPFSKE